MRNVKPASRTLTPDDLPTVPTVIFFNRLDRLLQQHRFDASAEEPCQPFYAQHLDRPTLPPGACYRVLLLGLDSESPIVLLAAASLSMRASLGYGRHESTPDRAPRYSNRRLLSVETHEQVFNWCLELLRQEGLAGRCQGGGGCHHPAGQRVLQRRDADVGGGGGGGVVRSSAEAQGAQLARLRIGRLERSMAHLYGSGGEHREAGAGPYPRLPLGSPDVIPHMDQDAAQPARPAASLA